LVAVLLAIHGAYLTVASQGELGFASSTSLMLRLVPYQTFLLLQAGLAT